MEHAEHVQREVETRVAGSRSDQGRPDLPSAGAQLQQQAVGTDLPQRADDLFHGRGRQACTPVEATRLGIECRVQGGPPLVGIKAAKAAGVYLARSAAADGILPSG